MTAESSSLGDTANLDATNEEEDVLDPAQTDDNNDNAPDPEDEDPAHLPNNDFCFTGDDFLECVTNMIDSTRRHSKWRYTWKRIHDLEGKEVVCQTVADDKVT